MRVLIMSYDRDKPDRKKVYREIVGDMSQATRANWGHDKIYYIGRVFRQIEADGSVSLPHPRVYDVTRQQLAELLGKEANILIWNVGTGTEYTASLSELI